MRYLVLAVVCLLPTATLAAGPVKVDAKDYSCSQLAQIIRQSKKVYVRLGFGGRNFRYPPAQCGPGDKLSTASLRDRTGQRCLLDYACVNDPMSMYNY
ncbi:hypothetical protein [Rhizobium sp. Root1220]|uniref:hypothetical protein n=1 Tax=Rhizobium sp. Root1220 TaxID=1736432 RepID=UPI0006FE6AEA|nr:hypothetical protein [Rhizobium sp. Root1220]KQV64456.1 hypothetical protein ASC90_16340 [Rhizobium sp. Root1220]